MEGRHRANIVSGQAAVLRTWWIEAEPVVYPPSITGRYIPFVLHPPTPHNTSKNEILSREASGSFRKPIKGRRTAVRFSLLR